MIPLNKWRGLAFLKGLTTVFIYNLFVSQKESFNKIFVPIPNSRL